MAWTAPRNWTDGEVVTADLLNEQIRDNLNETMCAKARRQGGYFTTLLPQDEDNLSGAQLVERFAVGHRISTAEQTTSTSYVALTTPGPTVTVEHGNSALIMMSCGIYFDMAISGQSVMSWGMSGANNRAPQHDPMALIQDGSNKANAVWNFSQTDLFLALTPGITTFTCYYKSGGGGGKATFQNRMIMVLPF
jgi:hypothetical protein